MIYDMLYIIHSIHVYNMYVALNYLGLILIVNGTNFVPFNLLSGITGTVLPVKRGFCGMPLSAFCLFNSPSEKDWRLLTFSEVLGTPTLVSDNAQKSLSLLISLFSFDNEGAEAFSLLLNSTCAADCISVLEP